MPRQTETSEDDQALADAAAEGVAAFMQGQRLEDNPYPYEHEPLLREAWEKGWLEYCKFYHR